MIATGNSNLANLVGNMDQQQLLQLLGGGAGGYADLATLAGLTGSPPSSAPSSAGGRSRESATPATGQPSAITSAASLQTPAVSVMLNCIAFRKKLEVFSVVVLLDHHHAHIVCVIIEIDCY